MGASSGLGKAVAQALRAEGAHVAICARNAKRVAAAAAELGAQGIVADLSVPGAAAQVVREAEKRLGQVDILVVNTGGPPPGLFAELQDGAWRFRSRRQQFLYVLPLKDLPSSLGDSLRKRWPGTAPARAELPDELPTYQRFGEIDSREG